MSEENKKITPELPEGLDNQELPNITEELPNLDFGTTPDLKKLHDGTEILEDNSNVEDVENDEEELSDEDLRKLVEFTKGIKDISDDELTEIRDDELELERLIKIAGAKSVNFKYEPRNVFTHTQRKKRQKKNRTARRSRAKNRR
jgi:hypothetical protein